MVAEDPLNRDITNLPTAFVCADDGRLYAAGYRRAVPVLPDDVPDWLQETAEDQLVVKTDAPCSCGCKYFRYVTLGQPEQPQNRMNPDP